MYFLRQGTVRLRLAVPRGSIIAFIYAELVLLDVLQEIEAEEEYLFSFVQSIAQVMPEEQPVVSKGKIE